VLHSSTTPPEDFEAARPDLRVKIWSRAGVEAQRLKAQLDGMGKDLEISGVPLGEHLIASLAYAWPESTQSIPPETLQGWGVTLYEAMEAGKHNLAETMLGYSKIGDNLVAFVSGDSYDACRILLVEKIRDMGLSGRPVAMVPNRDSVYITGEDDETGLTMMIKLAADAMNDQYGLSGVPLVLDGDHWVDWMPPPSHPSYATFRDLELKTLRPAYHEQEQLINALNERVVS
jgi:hypothetical protein